MKGITLNIMREIYGRIYIFGSTIHPITAAPMPIQGDRRAFGAEGGVFLEQWARHGGKSHKKSANIHRSFTDLGKLLVVILHKILYNIKVV